METIKQQHIHSDQVFERLLPAKAAAEALGISVSLFWRLNQLGTLPPPIYVTPKVPRWRWSELCAAMESRRKAGPPSKVAKGGRDDA